MEWAQKDGLMDVDAPASTWMPSPLRQPAITLTFDLQSQIKSSVGASEHAL